MDLTSLSLAVARALSAWRDVGEELASPVEPGNVSARSVIAVSALSRLRRSGKPQMRSSPRLSMQPMRQAMPLDRHVGARHRTSTPSRPTGEAVQARDRENRDWKRSRVGASDPGHGRPASLRLPPALSGDAAECLRPHRVESAAARDAGAGVQPSTPHREHCDARRLGLLPNLPDAGPTYPRAATGRPSCGARVHRAGGRNDPPTVAAPHEGAPFTGSEVVVVRDGI